MDGVIYDARRIKAYEGMKKLGSYFCALLFYQMILEYCRKC